MKLTKKIVDEAKPAEKDVWLWDSQLPGFGLRVKPTGLKSYLVQYRDAGNRTRRVTIGRHGVITTEQARLEAQQLLASVARGDNPAERRIEESEEPTIEDLAERYLREWAEAAGRDGKPRKKPKSITDDKQKLETYIKPEFKGRRVSSITRKDVAALHFKLRGTPTQANRTIALLSKMMNLAELWEWRPPGSNPCRLLEKYDEKKRKRYLTDAELEWIGQALKASEVSAGRIPKKAAAQPRKPTAAPQRPQDDPGPEYWAALLATRLLLLTGARLGEVLSLRWEYIDLQKSLIRLPDSKTGEKEIVLGPPAVDLLRDAPRKKGSPWVCPGERAGSGHMADLNGSWRRLKARVNELQDQAEAEGAIEKKDRVDLEGLRVHDLRHSFASVGVGGGLSLPMVGALLGHSQPATTARYAHLAADPLRQAAGMIAGHIAAVMDGLPGGKVVDMKEARDGR